MNLEEESTSQSLAKAKKLMLNSDTKHPHVVFFPCISFAIASVSLSVKAKYNSLTAIEAKAYKQWL